MPITIYEDNQSYIKFVTNQKFSKRTKHIDTKYHFVRDLNESNKISLKYHSTENMIADMLTKAVQRIRLLKLLKASGLISYTQDDESVIEKEY